LDGNLLGFGIGRIPVGEANTNAKADSSKSHNGEDTITIHKCAESATSTAFLLGQLVLSFFKVEVAFFVVESHVALYLKEMQ
jgi:hypothetical protein